MQRHNKLEKYVYIISSTRQTIRKKKVSNGNPCKGINHKMFIISSSTRKSVPRIGGGGSGGMIVDDYFLCVCVCDSIFPACVGALICETKTIYLTTYGKKKADGKGAGKIRGERELRNYAWYPLSTCSQPASQAQPSPASCCKSVV